MPVRAAIALCRFAEYAMQFPNVQNSSAVHLHPTYPTDSPFPMQMRPAGALNCGSAIRCYANERFIAPFISLNDMISGLISVILKFTATVANDIASIIVLQCIALY